MPAHFERVCSAIDELRRNLEIEFSQFGGSGLSQAVETHNLSDQSSLQAPSLLGETDSQPSRVASGDVTPDTSMSQRIDGGARKMVTRRRLTIELHQEVE